MKFIYRMISVILIYVALLLLPQAGYPGDWNINFMGISSKHFQGRDWKVVVAGCVASLAIHEASHLLYADLNGGGHYDFHERAAIMEDYYERSHSEQQNFHRAGFVGQIITGSILTAIPSTRHTDFTLGFNSFTAVNTLFYTINDGGMGQVLDPYPEKSDIIKLDHGVTEGFIYTGVAGALTYVNLKKPIGEEE